MSVYIFLFLRIVMPTCVFMVSLQNLLLKIFAEIMMFKSYISDTAAKNRHVKFCQIFPHV